MGKPVVQEKVESHSDIQRRRLWAMLTDLSRQLKWPVDGELQYLTKEDWKWVILAGLKKHQRIAKGIEGGFVVLGESIRDLNVKEMGDMITLLFAFGAEHDIVWSDPTEVPIEAYT